uniref:Uncharacterized protein n=1 Tax=mine drainage metagenome TaxID=410659 RepID=E6PD33_9ZZZZ
MEFVALAPRYCHAAWLGRMLKLPMATASCHDNPAVLRQAAKNLANTYRNGALFRRTVHDRPRGPKGRHLV